MILISCEASLAPGASWSIKVEFRPLSRGFSVWVLEDNSTVDRPRWQKVGADSKPLKWRTAGAYLARDEELRVFGDFWGAVEITGTPRWAENVLRCIFIQDEDAELDYRAIGELLMGFTDKEIKSILAEVELIPPDPGEDAPAALLALESLSKVARTLGLVGQTLAQIKAAIKLHGAASLEEVATKAEVEKTQRRIATLLAEPEEARQDNLSAVDGYRNEEGVTRSAAEARHQYWAELSEGPCPDDLAQRIALVDRWLSELLKPMGGGPSRGMRLPTSEWPILKWLLGEEDQLRSLLERLATDRPSKATALVEEVMKRGKAEAHYFEGPNRFSGWAENMIGRPIKRSNVQLALQIQSLADALKVPLDAKYRIGDLPYLT